MNFFNIFKFWYPDAFMVFFRVWSNSMTVLEEDMAVRLMAKLLFVPLFHDSTIAGRILSFLFRLVRIILGLMAYTLVTVLILTVAFLWFLLPLLFVIGFWLKPALEPHLPGVSYFYFSILGLVALIGIAKFISLQIHRPLKAVWQIKDKTEIWQTTHLKLENASFEKLLLTPEVEKLLSLLEITPKDLEGLEPVPLDDEILEKTLDLAKKCGARYLSPEYFFVAILSHIFVVENFLLKLNLKLDDFGSALSYLEHVRQKWRKVFIWDDDFSIKHLRGVNRGWLGAPTPNLDAVSTDLTLQAAKVGFPDFTGRGDVVSEVITVLSQDTDRNILLVGPVGAGKSTLVDYLAKIIVSGDAPPAMATKRLVLLDFSRLISGADTEGGLAERVKQVFEDVAFIQDIIIFIDEIHNMGAGEAGSKLNLLSLMLPYLEQNRFQVIASTESDNYAKFIAKNASFARLFHKVEVPPTSEEETKTILFDEAVELLRYKKISITVKAIQEITELSKKLIHDRVLPDSALSVLKECEVKAINGQITSQVVKEVFEKRVNVPVLEMDQEQKQTLLHLEDVIHKKMIDQEEAVKAVADTLRRASTALRDQNRPIGSFLFVGPTGVGKTELAKTLSEVYFKTDAAFLRFDMSEYQTDEAVDRLLGTSDNPGELTEAVKNKPYALVLLDEFEKANSRILTLFLQVLDDGRLTDAAGTTVDFSNTIIIATSNAASLQIAQGIGQGKTTKDLEAVVKAELLKVYKPELVNRFDSVVIFKPLSQEDLEKIVILKLQGITKLLLDEGYIIEYTPGLISQLAKKGFDPVLGARPLRRLIQDTLEAKLSKMILENSLKKGEKFVGDENLLSP